MQPVVQTRRSPNPWNFREWLCAPLWARCEADRCPDEVGCQRKVALEETRLAVKSYDARRRAGSGSFFNPGFPPELRPPF